MASDAAPAAAPPQATRVMSATSVSSVADFAYPHGHLGSLSEKQEQALEDFKDLLEERDYWKRGPPASHDDPTLLRFLRARRWVPADAFQQFKETEDWRVANDIDVLYRTIDLDAYDSSRRLYPQWTGRRDRRGIPLYVFEVKPLDTKAIAEYERLGSSNTFSEAKTDGKTASGLLRLFALYENLTRFNHPFCSQLKDREYPDTPITMSTNIVDISGVGLKQFWNLKTHMQAASQLATAHYPETLDRIFIIGAPMFFSTVWGWIKKWFDPITVSKIFILNSSEVKPTLESFIDPRNIPKKYGGQLDFKFGDMPVSDPTWEGVVNWENGHTSFPSGPLLWEEIDGGKTLACTRFGTKNKEKNAERICTVPKVWPPEEEVNGTTQAAEPEIADSTTETDTKNDDAITNGKDLSKLNITDEEKANQAEAGLPTTAPTVAA